MGRSSISSGDCPLHFSNIYIYIFIPINEVPIQHLQIAEVQFLRIIFICLS